MLEHLTNDFFQLHWNQGLGAFPSWGPLWSVTSQGPIPSGDKQGCYALYAGNSLLYVGLGARRGSGLYKQHGIGARLCSHVLIVDWNKQPADGKRFYKQREKWPDVTHLRTIGFPSGTGYLAAALEGFLLKNLDEVPAFNSQRPGSA